MENCFNSLLNMKWKNSVRTVELDTVRNKFDEQVDISHVVSCGHNFNSVSNHFSVTIVIPVVMLPQSLVSGHGTIRSLVEPDPCYSTSGESSRTNLVLSMRTNIVACSDQWLCGNTVQTGSRKDYLRDGVCQESNRYLLWVG